MAPIPALPDTERRTSYDLVAATTGPLAVGFQIYGDGADYENWIEVWHEGERLSAGTDWTLDSPSGPLHTQPRPIVDARVTLSVERTGTVDIVGARRPRRTSQFVEGVGISARTHNQILTDHTAVLRELWDLRERTMMSAPGLAPPRLPLPEAGKYLRWRVDLAGLENSEVQIPVGSFQLASKSEAEAGTSHDVLMTPLRVKQAIDKFAVSSGAIDVRMFGAVAFPDEASGLAGPDQSGAFAAALTFADGREILVPPGYFRISTDAAVFRIPISAKRRVAAPKWTGSGFYKTYIICDAANSAVLGTRLSQAAHDAGGFYYCWGGWIRDMTFVRGTAANASAIEIVGTDTFDIQFVCETNGAGLGLTGHALMFPLSLGGSLPPSALTADSIQSQNIKIDGLINGVARAGVFNPHGGLGNCVCAANIANCGWSGVYTKSGQWDFTGVFSSNATDAAHPSEQRGGLVLAFAAESGSTPHNIRLKCEFDDNRYAHIQASAASGLVADGCRFVQQVSARPGIDIILGSSSGSLVSNSTFRDCSFRHAGSASPNNSFFSIGPNQVDIINAAWTYDPGTTNTTKYAGDLSQFNVLDTSTNMYSPATNTLAWKTNGVHRGRIEPAGALLWGTAVTPSATQAGTRIGDMVNNGHLFSSGTVASFGVATFINANGPVGSIAMSASATAYNTSSDGRLKTERVALEAIEIVRALQAYEFTWEYAAGRPRGVGFIAQEVWQVVPDAVTPGDKDPNLRPGHEGFEPWAIDQSKLVPHLWAGCRWMLTTIESQRAEIQALTAALQALDQRVAALEP